MAITATDEEDFLRFLYYWAVQNTKIRDHWIYRPPIGGDVFDT